MSGDLAPRGPAKIVAIILVSMVLLIGISGVAGWFLLGRIDLGAFIAGRVSARIGRPVTIASAHVTPGRWVAIDLQGLSLPNLDGGSQPVMTAARHLVAQVRLSSLLHGHLAIRGASIEDLSVLLERVNDVPNWWFGPGHTPLHWQRATFPWLQDLRLHRSEIVSISQKGSRRVVRLDDALLLSPADDQPVRLSGTGAYDDVPLQLEAKLKSIGDYRNNSEPFGTNLHFRSGDALLVFDGTMTHPLDVDGAIGQLTLDAPALTPLLALLGKPSTLNLSLHLAGTLDHANDVWSLGAATGVLEEQPFTGGSVRLAEGTKQHADDLAVQVAFEHLDLNELLGTGARGKRSGGDLKLAVASAPSTVGEVKISARRLSYDALSATDVAAAARLSPGKVLVEELSMTAFGTRVRGSGQVVGAGRVTAEVAATGADVQMLRRALGFGIVPVLGALEGTFQADATAPTLSQAIREARVNGVIAMRGGSIAKEVIELASTDVSALFRTARGMSVVSCLLAGLDMHAGVGTIAPLRVRAADGVIAGSARFNLSRRVFDLTVGSEAHTTGALALDIPIRVHGSFGSPSVEPAQWTPEGRAQLTRADDLSHLSVSLREMARRHPCPP